MFCLLKGVIDFKKIGNGLSLEGGDIFVIFAIKFLFQIFRSKQKSETKMHTF